jgi:putative oxidoreductase
MTNTLLERTVVTRSPAAVILIRLMVGSVFFSEGFQKFLYPTENGIARFARIGIPFPELTAPLVGIIEIVCGFLLIIGLFTRLAAIPLIIDIAVAIVSTKIPILLGHGFWGFSFKQTAYGGFWGMAHEVRTDFCMFLGGLFLLIVGAGPWSLDRGIRSRLR